MLRRDLVFSSRQYLLVHEIVGFLQLTYCLPCDLRRKEWSVSIVCPGSGKLVLMPLKERRVLPVAFLGLFKCRSLVCCQPLVYCQPTQRPIFLSVTEKQHFKTMVNEARLRRIKFERMQREALVRQRAEATVRKVFQQNRERAARAIQVQK